MGSNANNLITNEIAYLEEEITRLEFELTQTSTPRVERHVRHEHLTDHTPRQSAMTGLSEYQTEIQREGASRLADHSSLAGQRGMADQDDCHVSMAHHQQNGNQNTRYRPFISHGAHNGDNMVANGTPSQRSENYGRSQIFSQKRNFVKCSTFDGTSSWSDFKSHFEVCAELNGWSVHEKGMHLAVSLRGNAQGVLSNLPANDQHNYDEM